MGWSDTPNDVFDGTVQLLLDNEVEAARVTATCSSLIRTFLSSDWDTAEDSLEKWAARPEVVAAFAANDLRFDYCEAEPPGQPWVLCKREPGHDGEHRGRHGRTWGVEHVPPLERLQAAVDKANAGAKVLAMRKLRDVYQLAVRWQGTRGREDAAAELLAVLDLGEP